MGPIPSQYVDQYKGLSVPADDRLPWNPWSSKEFKFQENKTYGNWQPWNYSCFENINDENRQSSQLFGQSKSFPPAIGSFGTMQTNPRVFGTDQTLIFQNTFNENQKKHFQKCNSRMDHVSRKRYRRNRKLNQPWRMLKQNTTGNSHFESRQQSYQNWSHAPVLEWSRSNASPRAAEAGFRNVPFRSGSLTARDISGTPTNASVSRAYFKFGNNSSRSMGNAAPLTPNAKCLNGANMNGKEKETTSNYSEKVNDDDVMYLFTVDSSSEGKMVLEIDLQSDGVNLIPNSSSPEDEKSKNVDDQSIITIEGPELNKPLTRKRKLSKSNNKTSKRPSHRPKCSACKRNYDDVIAKKQNMFISSSCSHIVCAPCISKDEQSKVCPVCEIKLIAFRRLYV